jgi:GNAT superfamily N-acetyltransferase
MDGLRRFAESNGKFRYCACMRWRLASTDFSGTDPEERGRMFGELVRSPVAVGILAYQGDDPVGWCSVAPTATYVAIERSRNITRLNQEGAWSVVCFFLEPRVRSTGLQKLLLDAAINYARDEGAQILDAFPWPGGPSYRYMGTRELYLSRGFEDISVAEGKRPRMSLNLT